MNKVIEILIDLDQKFTANSMNLFEVWLDWASQLFDSISGDRTEISEKAIPIRIPVEEESRTSDKDEPDRMEHY